MDWNFTVFCSFWHPHTFLLIIFYNVLSSPFSKEFLSLFILPCIPPLFVSCTHWSTHVQGPFVFFLWSVPKITFLFIPPFTLFWLPSHWSFYLIPPLIEIIIILILRVPRWFDSAFKVVFYQRRSRSSGRRDFEYSWMKCLALKMLKWRWSVGGGGAICFSQQVTAWHTVCAEITTLAEDSSIWRQ